MMKRGEKDSSSTKAWCAEDKKLPANSIQSPQDITLKRNPTLILQGHGGLGHFGSIKVLVLVLRHCRVQVQHQGGYGEIVCALVGRGEEVVD